MDGILFICLSLVRVFFRTIHPQMMKTRLFESDRYPKSRNSHRDQVDDYLGKPNSDGSWLSPLLHCRHQSFHSHFHQTGLSISNDQSNFPQPPLLSAFLLLCHPALEKLKVFIMLDMTWEYQRERVVRITTGSPYEYAMLDLEPLLHCNNKTRMWGERICMTQNEKCGRWTKMNALPTHRKSGVREKWKVKIPRSSVSLFLLLFLNNREKRMKQDVAS